MASSAPDHLRTPGLISNRPCYEGIKRYTLDSLFANKPARFESSSTGSARWSSPVALSRCFHTGIRGLHGAGAFCGAVPKTKWLDIGFWLTRRIEDPRFHKIETLYPSAHVHLLCITNAEQLDDQVTEWTKEAYNVGCQEHLA